MAATLLSAAAVPRCPRPTAPRRLVSQSRRLCGCRSIVANVDSGDRHARPTATARAAARRFGRSEAQWFSQPRRLLWPRRSFCTCCALATSAVLWSLASFICGTAEPAEDQQPCRSAAADQQPGISSPDQQDQQPRISSPGSAARISSPGSAAQDQQPRISSRHTPWCAHGRTPHAAYPHRLSRAARRGRATLVSRSRRMRRCKERATRRDGCAGVQVDECSPQAGRARCGRCSERRLC